MSEDYDNEDFDPPAPSSSQPPFALNNHNNHHEEQKHRPIHSNPNDTNHHHPPHTSASSSSSPNTTTLDQNPNHHQQSPSTSLPSSSPSSSPSTLRSSPMYQLAWEMESWKKTERAKFESEMRALRLTALKSLEDEYRRNEILREKETAKKVMDISVLEKKLSQSLFDCEKHEKLLKLKEIELQHKLSHLHSEITRHDTEAELSVKRIKDQYSHHMTQFKMRENGYQQHIDTLKAEILSWSAKYKDMELQYNVYKSKVSKSTVGELRVELLEKDKEMERMLALYEEEKKERRKSDQRVSLCIEEIGKMKKKIENEERKVLDMEREEMNRQRREYTNKVNSMGWRRDKEELEGIQRDIEKMKRGTMEKGEEKENGNMTRTMVYTIGGNHHALNNTFHPMTQMDKSNGGQDQNHRDNHQNTQIPSHHSHPSQSQQIHIPFSATTHTHTQHSHPLPSSSPSSSPPSSSPLFPPLSFTMGGRTAGDIPFDTPHFEDQYFNAIQQTATATAATSSSYNDPTHQHHNDNNHNNHHIPHPVHPHPPPSSTSQPLFSSSLDEVAIRNEMQTRIPVPSNNERERERERKRDEEKGKEEEVEDAEEEENENHHHHPHRNEEDYSEESYETESKYFNDSPSTPHPHHPPPSTLPLASSPPSTHRSTTSTNGPLSSRSTTRIVRKGTAGTGAAAARAARIERENKGKVERERRLRI